MEKSSKSSALVFGSHGRLGRDVVRVLSSEYTVHGTTSDSVKKGSSHSTHQFVVDEGFTDSLCCLIDMIKPSVIVNCIAITPDNVSESGVERLFLVNSIFPVVLESVVRSKFAELEVRLIHVSTDSIYSSREGRAKEEEIPEPESLYSKSKLLGEIKGANSVTIRTSFYANDICGRGLLEWLLKSEGEKIRGFSGYKLSAISSTRLARYIASLCDSLRFYNGIINIGGLSHSKYQFIKEYSDAAGLNVEIIECSKVCRDYSLDVSKFYSLMGVDPPTLSETVQELLDSRQKIG